MKGKSDIGLGNHTGDRIDSRSNKRADALWLVDCQLKKLWCGYLTGMINPDAYRRNAASLLRSDVKEWPLIHQTLTEHVLFITKEEWEQNKQEEATRK